MKLLVHIGLHKTATTYLQHLLFRNSGRLAQAGVHYKPEAPHAAHHIAAWQALAGDPDPVAAIVRDARTAKARAVLVSSEDFEGLLFNPEFARTLEHAAAAEGASRVEWHICLRDPGQYFASIFAEMSNHQFVDGLSLYQSAIDQGYGRLETREGAIGVPPYWQFCFDHERHIFRFAAHLSGTVVLHDYRDATPYPAHRMLRSLGVIDLLTELPPEETRNVRRPSAWVESQYFQRAMNLLKGMELPQGAILRLNERLGATTELIAPMSKEITRLYTPGMVRLLSRAVIRPNRSPSAVASFAGPAAQTDRHWKEIITRSASEPFAPVSEIGIEVKVDRVRQPEHVAGQRH